MPIPTPRDDETEEAFVGRCHEVLADEYDDQDQRHAICMTAWSEGAPGANTCRSMAVMRVSQGVELRREDLDGREHVVLPLTALVDGVFQCANCPRPNYYPAGEFGKNVGAWNGRPVTIGHPMRDGSFVSAGSPDVWATERIGTTFGARLDGDALKLEAWIDPEAVARAGEEAQAVMRAAEGGEAVEVSTAAWVDEVPRVGSKGGKKFEAVNQHFQPDHMAILPLGQVGACSWEDGCGVRVNAGELGQVTAVEEARMPMEAPTVQQTARSKDAALQMALDDVVGGEGAWIVDWDESYVYYAKWGEAHLRRRSYDEDNEGAVTLGDDEERVRPRTEFVVAEKEIGDMAEETKTAAPSPEGEGKEPQAQASPLERQLADALAKVEHLEGKLAKRVEPQTEEEFIAQAPPKMQAALVGLLKAQRVRELEQIDVILQATDQWSEDELKAMTADQLDKIAKLANSRSGVDYSVRMAEASRLAAADVDEDHMPLPVSPWDRPAGQA